MTVIEAIESIAKSRQVQVVTLYDTLAVPAYDYNQLHKQLVDELGNTVGISAVHRTKKVISASKTPICLVTINCLPTKSAIIHAINAYAVIKLAIKPLSLQMPEMHSGIERMQNTDSIVYDDKKNAINVYSKDVFHMARLEGFDVEDL